MRALLFTVLISFSAVACVTDDEEVDVADDQVDTVTRDVAPVTPPEASFSSTRVPAKTPDATFTSTRDQLQRPSKHRNPDRADPSTSLPPFEEEPQDLGESAKPGSPTRPETTRITNPNTTF